MTAMLASDLNNPNFSGATNPDSMLHVEFYMYTEKDNFQSEKEGRPIFFDVPYVRIMTPGNQNNIIDTIAREEHKIRFPLQWAKFQNSHDPKDQIIGTPVDEWPAIGRAQAEELKGVKFYTVEQIAGASDAQIQRLGMNGQVLKQKAQAFLGAAKDSALEQRLAAELERERQEKNALNERIARLEQMLGNQAEEKPKRKYTRRAKPESQETQDEST